MNYTDLLFVLALIATSFLGYKIINRVPSLLHTPLMSGMNAFSGITLIACMYILPLAAKLGGLAGKILAMIAIVLASINIISGFLVTDRMLKMFKTKEDK